MAFATASDGTRLHYEAVGNADGPPVLLIQGLGADKKGWAFQRMALSSRFRVLALDNRGVGKSDKPVGRYSLDLMARDALAVLDAEGIDSAHVVGASMGGAISQVIGVLYPERVRSLTLACTACSHHPWRRELLDEWAAVAMEQGMRALSNRALRWLVGPRSVRRFWPALGILGPLAMSIPPYAFAAQVRAILDFDDAIRTELVNVKVPTLVLVGSQDILTPQGDSEEIAEMIPGAELVVIRGAAHGFMVEHASTFNRTMIDFLDRVVAAEQAVATSEPLVIDARDRPVPTPVAETSRATA